MFCELGPSSFPGNHAAILTSDNGHFVQKWPTPIDLFHIRLIHFPLNLEKIFPSLRRKDVSLLVNAQHSAEESQF